MPVTLHGLAHQGAGEISASVDAWEKGVGDESDKLVTIDVDPSSKTYGKIVNALSVGGRGEAHHMGFTDDRKYIWAGRLDDSKIFIFDVGTDPAKPKLVNTITDFDKQDRLCRPAYFLRVAWPHADRRAFQHQGPRRRDRLGHLQQ